jgi:hypothetical protein
VCVCVYLCLCQCAVVSFSKQVMKMCIMIWWHFHKEWKKGVGWADGVA